MVEIPKIPLNCNNANELVAKVYSCDSETFTISCNLCNYAINSFKRFQTHCKKHMENIDKNKCNGEELQTIEHVEMKYVNVKPEETSDVEEVHQSKCLINCKSNKWEDDSQPSEENIESSNKEKFLRLDIELDEHRLHYFPKVNNYITIKEECSAEENDIGFEEEYQEEYKEAEGVIDVMDSTSSSENIMAGYKKQKRELIRAKPRRKNKSFTSYFSCTYCDKKFNNNSNRKTHELRHSTSRPYLCDTCAKSFYTQGELDVHNLFHNDERPFVCEECGKGFRRSWVLKKHRRTHSTHEATLPCPKCNKLFSFNDNLRNHMQIHNTIANIICEFCDEAFTHRKKYRRHVQKKHTSKKNNL